MTDLFVTLLKTLATRGRIFALGALGFLTILLAILVRGTSIEHRADAAFMLVNAYGLTLLVPVVALVFAAASLGDLAEDGTLVYLWLRPVARWKLAFAAALASLTISIPIAVVPVVIGAAITGQGGRFVVGAMCGSLLSAAAYTAVFMGLGLRVRRALAWGLAYLVIWEGAVARIARGAARISISVTTRTLFARVAHHTELPRNAMSMPVAIFVPVAAIVIAIVLTARSLDRGEVA
jgi:ABC-2 type transport system permease protein